MFPVYKQSSERKYSLSAHPEQLLVGFQIACQTSGLCSKSILSGFPSIKEAKLDLCGAKCNLPSRKVNYNLNLSNSRKCINKYIIIPKIEFN